MMELVDKPVLKTGVRKYVRVRVPLVALWKSQAQFILSLKKVGGLVRCIDRAEGYRVFTSPDKNLEVSIEYIDEISREEVAKEEGLYITSRGFAYYRRYKQSFGSLHYWHSITREQFYEHMKGKVW